MAEPPELADDTFWGVLWNSPFSPPPWLVGAGLLLVGVFGALAKLGHWYSSLKYLEPVARWLSGKTKRVVRRRSARRRVQRLKQFAGYLEDQVLRLPDKEWSDDHYIELEVELTTGSGAWSGLRSWLSPSSPSTPTVFPSLSVALRESSERIVLLEGEPGAGKTVAMRHLAQRMAGEAKLEPAVIPIYVDLKNFVPADGTPSVDNLREFVLHSIDYAGDRTIEQFVREEFQTGLEAGTWLFLFDSFDEIPSILSADNAAPVITAYADVLHVFLNGLNPCRGVVASREFRGPDQRSWLRQRILPLSKQRRTDLVKKVKLSPEVEQELLAALPSAELASRKVIDTPLFLRLLCEHMRAKREFSTNFHTVIETYVGHRLLRDVDLVRTLYGSTQEVLRDVAEELACAMVERDSLTQAGVVEVLAVRLQITKKKVHQAIEALKSTKLAQTGNDGVSVAFAHRKIQDYFATCVILRDPDRVPYRALLTEPRWRDAAVAVLQTEDVPDLLDEALLLLSDVGPSDTARPWSPGVRHLLGILSEGSSPAALTRLAPEIPRRVGLILRQAWDYGQRLERQRALELCSTADRDTYLWLVRNGFASDSEWLRQESYTQVTRVPDITEDVAQEFCQTLVNMSVNGQLRRDRGLVLSQIRRLPNPARFLPSYWLLLIGPFVNALLGIGIFGCCFFLDSPRPGLLNAIAGAGVTTVVAVAPFHLFRMSLASEAGRDRRMRWIPSPLGVVRPLALMLAAQGLLAVDFFAVVLVAVQSGTLPQALPMIVLLGAVWVCATSTTAVMSGLHGRPVQIWCDILLAPFRTSWSLLRELLRTVWRVHVLLAFGMLASGWVLLIFRDHFADFGSVLVGLLTLLLVGTVGSALVALRFGAVNYLARATARTKLSTIRHGCRRSELWVFLLSMREAGSVEFFLTEARKAEIEWSPDSVDLLNCISEWMNCQLSDDGSIPEEELRPLPAIPDWVKPRSVPQWFRSTGVLDALSILLGDIAKKEL